jgi:hypothetical protein
MKKSNRKGKAKKARRKYVRVPVPPTKAMLRGMSSATFLTDGSDLEMERRFNGMLEGLKPG